jgi:hypothetical protein
VLVLLYAVALGQRASGRKGLDPVQPDQRAELRQKGVDYQRYQSEQLDGFLVRKSAVRLLGEVTILTLATPITLTVDGAVVVMHLWADLGRPGRPHWQAVQTCLSFLGEESCGLLFLLLSGGCCLYSGDPVA